MIRNASHFPDCKLFEPVRHTPVRSEKPRDEKTSVRNRWPFTVAADDVALLPDEGQGRLHEPADTRTFIS
jgi:hypothetical protein